MTRVLVLGAGGMLGHRMCLSLADRYDVVGVARSRPAAEGPLQLLTLPNNLDVKDCDSLDALLRRVEPDVVLNCAGVVKQRRHVKPTDFIRVNSLFPHILSELCERIGSRVIHFGTDCVFSGTAGPYPEDRTPDPVDIYGRSKLLGEVEARNTLVLRTSIIGPEINNRLGLLEWLLSQNGKTIRGFTKALFTGVTAVELAALVADLISDHRDLHGIWHVAGDSIGKLELLNTIRDVYGLKVAIEPYDQFECDRRLDGSRFAVATGYKAPSWPEMIYEMHALHVSGYPYSRNAA